MYRWLILFAFLPSAALADGAVAVGYRGDTLVTTMAVSRSTAENARNLALKDCSATASRCAIVHDFKNTCTATVLFNDRQLDIGHGKTRLDAQNDALARCKARGAPCSPQYVSCDPAPLTAETVPAPQTAPQPSNQESHSYFFLVYIIIILLLLIFGGMIASRIVSNPNLADFFVKWRTQSVVIPPPVTPELTEAAGQQLNAALDFIERVLGEHRKPKITSDEIKRLIEMLNRAAEHLVKARGFDPTATISPDLTDKQALSQETIASMLLFLEASCEMALAHKAPFGSIGRSHLKRSRDALIQALTYQQTVEYYRRLGEIYAYLGDKVRAEANVRKALDLDLDDVESTQLLNHLPDELWPYPAFYEFKIAALILFALLSIAALFTTSPYLALAPWVALLGWYLARNELRKLLAKIPYSYAHYREKADEKKHRDHLANLYKKRWQQET